jgi:hypothetical protein
MTKFTALLLLAGCASLPVAQTPIGSIFDAPKEYEGRTVRVCGWFVSGMEQCTLSREPQGAPMLTVDSSATLWVTPKSGVCLPINAFRKPKATWAVVEGTFRTSGGWGHLGQYQHTIEGEVKPIDGGCDAAGSAPNSSFKPKPLRGSA